MKKPNAQKAAKEPPRKGEVSACVGIAGSAMSLPALKALLSALPPDTGASFLVALRPDEEPRDDGLVKVLSGVTELAVGIAEEGASLEPDRLYVVRDAQV